MGTQGAGRRRSTNKEKSTAEDDALNLIAREAEARLAAKRAARAEAREIRMKELERQQKEIFQVQKKYYGLNSLDERVDNRWGDIEQWMEDSEKYSRSSRIQTLSDDDEQMSVGSRGSVRSDLDSVGAFGGGGSSFHKKSKKKKKHKHKDRNGYDDDYSRSSRLSDEGRMSRSSRLDLQPASSSSSDLYSLNGLSSRNQGSAFNGTQNSLYEDSVFNGCRRVSGSSSHSIEYSAYRSSRASSRASSARTSPVDNCSSVGSFLRSSASSLVPDLDHVTVPDSSEVDDRDHHDKGPRAGSALTASTLTSLGGSSSRRGSGETSLTVDAESSIREIKEIHELKDQIQDVETKYMQNLKEVKDSLAEAEEKYRKAMVSNAQLDNEKNNLMYQVDTLKDSLTELEELLSESRREHQEKVKEFEREKHAHSVLQFHFNEMKETLKQSEELLNEIRQLRLKQEAFVREVSDLQETVEWKDKKIGALERQKEYTDAIRLERDELREEVVKLKDVLKKHGVILGPDLNLSEDVGEAEGNPGAEPVSVSAPDPLTSPAEGNSVLGSTEEAEQTSCREEEVEPEQDQETVEKVWSPDPVCNVPEVSKPETRSKNQKPPEERDPRSPEEDLSSPTTEANMLITVSRDHQEIQTSAEEHVPQTIRSEEESSKSPPEILEPEAQSSPAGSHENRKEKGNKEEESRVRDPQKNDDHVLKKEISVHKSNTEALREPETTEEVDHDEEGPKKAPPPGSTASGKKKKKKRKGKKKGGVHENKNHQTEKEPAARRNGSTAEPDPETSPQEEQLEQDNQEPEPPKPAEPTEKVSQNEVPQEPVPDPVCDELHEGQTINTKTLEEAEGDGSTETPGHTEGATSGLQNVEGSSETEEPVEPAESFSRREHLREPTTDHVSEEPDSEKPADTDSLRGRVERSEEVPDHHQKPEEAEEHQPTPEEAESGSSLEPEADLLTSGTPEDPDRGFISGVDPSVSGDLSGGGPLHSRSEAVDVKESCDWMKPESRTTSLKPDGPDAAESTSISERKDLNSNQEPAHKEEPRTPCIVISVVPEEEAEVEDDEELTASRQDGDEGDDREPEEQPELDSSLPTENQGCEDNVPDVENRSPADLDSDAAAGLTTALGPEEELERSVEKNSAVPEDLEPEDALQDENTGSSVVPLTEEEEEEDEEGQSFDFDDLDVEAAVESSLSNKPEEEDIEVGAEVLPEDVHSGSSDLSQRNVENRKEKESDGAGDQEDQTDRDTGLKEDQEVLAHEETLKEVEHVCVENLNPTKEETGAADPEEEGKRWNVEEQAIISENTEQKISSSVEEGLDVIKLDLDLPKTAEQIGGNKEPPQSGKEGKSQKKGKGKEECKMS